MGEQEKVPSVVLLPIEVDARMIYEAKAKRQNAENLGLRHPNYLRYEDELLVLGLEPSGVGS